MTATLTSEPLNTADAFEALYEHARLPQVEPFTVLDFDPTDQTPTLVAFHEDICENV